MKFIINHMKFIIIKISKLMGFGMGFGIWDGIWDLGWDFGIWDGIWDFGMGGILPFPSIWAASIFRLDFEASSNSSNSSLEKNRTCFKQVFDSNKEEGDTMDYAFETFNEICINCINELKICIKFVI